MAERNKNAGIPEGFDPLEKARELLRQSQAEQEADGERDPERWADLRMLNSQVRTAFLGLTDKD